MRHFTTNEFFIQFRKLKECEDVPVSKSVWLRNLYAFASKYEIMSDKQYKILQDIALKAGFDFTDCVQTEGQSNEMV